MLYNNLIDQKIDLNKLGKAFSASEYPVDDIYLPYLPLLIDILSGMYGTTEQIYNSPKLSELLKEHFRVTEIKTKKTLTIWNPYTYGLTIHINPSKFKTNLYDILYIEIRSNIYTNYNHHPIHIKMEESQKNNLTIICKGPEYPVYL